MRITLMSKEKRQQRIFDNSIPEPNSGCWIRLKALTPAGYGVIRINYELFYAHRLSYEAFKGPIPKDREIDHLCRSTWCVNPDHLEAVSHRKNCQRGICGEVNARRMRAKTHCPYGHPYSGDNLYIKPNTPGHRDCRTCLRFAATGRSRSEQIKVPSLTHERRP